MANLHCCPTRRPDHQHHDLISPIVTLSLHRAKKKKSLPHPNNAEHVTSKWQVYIFKSLVWLKQHSNLWVQIVRSSKTRDGRSTDLAFSSGNLQMTMTAWSRSSCPSPCTGPFWRPACGSRPRWSASTVTGTCPTQWSHTPTPSRATRSWPSPRKRRYSSIQYNAIEIQL